MEKRFRILEYRVDTLEKKVADLEVQVQSQPKMNAETIKRQLQKRDKDNYRSNYF